jgi:hypothetical protein
MSCAEYGGDRVSIPAGTTSADFFKSRFDPASNARISESFEHDI